MVRRGKRRRFDLIEVALIVLLASVCVWAVSRPSDLIPSQDAAQLRAKYGRAHNSRNGEEWIIRDFFQDRRGGVFVDVGANHYQRENNTYYLETTLGWRGIAIDPLRHFEADYLKYRPQTAFRAFFVSDVSNEQAKLYTLKSNSLVTSGEKGFTGQFGKNVQELTAPTITLNDLLDHEGINEIDFMSMDIELWEPKALAGFDIKRFHPALVCIEAHTEVRQQILEYFARNGYVIVGKYLRADVVNLYFMPAGA